MGWDYGGAFEKFPMKPNAVYKYSNGSTIKVHNIFEPLPSFMKQADLIFCDPPWNMGNLQSFYTKAEVTDRIDNFKTFYSRLFECLAEISPNTCYIEIGKEYLSVFVEKLKAMYKYVHFYNSTYYHRLDNKCYVVRASNKAKKPKLDDIDEEDIISWICENEDFKCIGDLCMGRGLVGLYAYKNNKSFVGTELNHKRLSVLVERIYNLSSEIPKEVIPDLVDDINFNRIKELSGMTYKELSNVLDIPERTVVDWSLGKRNPPKYTLRLIHYYLSNEGIIGNK